MQLQRLDAVTKGRPHLGREIAITLAIKLLLLFGLWYVFFSRPAIDSMIQGMDPGRVAAAAIAPSTPTGPARESSP